MAHHLWLFPKRLQEMGFPLCEGMTRRKQVIVYLGCGPACLHLAM